MIPGLPFMVMSHVPMVEMSREELREEFKTAETNIEQSVQDMEAP